MGKRSSVKKDTMMLRRLVGEVSGEDEQNNQSLYDVARQSALSRVVVKRPALARPICGSTPNSTVDGSTHRFDIYIQKVRGCAVRSSSSGSSSG